MTVGRYSYNIPISDVHRAVVKVLVEMPLEENPTAQGKASLTAVLRVSTPLMTVPALPLRVSTPLTAVPRVITPLRIP